MFGTYGLSYGKNETARQAKARSYGNSRQLKIFIAAVKLMEGNHGLLVNGLLILESRKHSSGYLQVSLMANFTDFGAF